MIDNIFNKITLIIALSLSAVISMSAQTKTITRNFNEINGVKADNAFNISLKFSPDVNYVSMRITAELEPYIEIYNIGKILYMELNRKDMPKDLRKKYKGKNLEKAVLDVDVYLTKLQLLTLSDKTVLSAVGSEFSGEKVEISLSDDAKINNLKLNCENVVLNVKNSSELNVDVVADNISFTSGNSSKSSIKGIANNVEFLADGSSRLSFDGTASIVNSDSQFRSSIVMTGLADSINVKSSGFSKQELLGLKTRVAKTNINNSSDVYLNVEQKLYVQVKGAKLFFTGRPLFELESVVNGTVQHYEK